MTIHSECFLKTGGDPRSLTDYARLRDELSKLSHPARPDINWLQAENLCLALFKQNGVELQTAAWYTLVRMHRSGVSGLNEGLAILAALLSHQWDILWPQSVSARMEIIGSLSKRLQQVTRAFTFSIADLGSLYLTEQHLDHLSNTLQNRELKYLSQMESLRAQLHHVVLGLESAANSEAQNIPPASPPADSMDLPGPAAIPQQWIFVAQPDSEVKISPTVRPWKAFAAGMALTLVVGGASLWSWQFWHRSDPLEEQLNALLASAPAPLSAAQLQILRGQNLKPQLIISQAQQQLERLSRLPPDHAFRQGILLIQQIQALLPEDPTAKRLMQQWRQQFDVTALPVASLSGWHQGMTRLQQLTDRLNGLDEQHGKYMTVSELKSQVFAITQSFSQTPPVEEQLRQLQEQPHPASPALLAVTNSHLRQILSRYALLESEAGEGM